MVGSWPCGGGLDFDGEGGREEGRGRGRGVGTVKKSNPSKKVDPEYAVSRVYILLWTDKDDAVENNMKKQRQIERGKEGERLEKVRAVMVGKGASSSFVWET